VFDGVAVYHCCLCAVLQSGLAQYFALDERRLSRWLRAIEEAYCNNSYHNRIHGADVTQRLFVMLTRGGLQQGLSHIHKLAALLAAVRSFLFKYDLALALVKP
jgi:hypothetical protein